MKIVYPDYYNDFRCSAGECIDTCCAGWEIVVDSESAEKYHSVSGEFGKKLQNMMTTDEDDDIIFKSQNSRCPFLNEKNLCDIYINCGEGFLCHTCNMFPRFVEEFGSVREIGIGLGCPEAAKIILNQKKEWSFLSEINDELPEPNDIEPELYYSLLELRKKLFEIVFNKSITAECALAEILRLADLCQSMIDEENYESVCGICNSFSINKNAKLKLFGREAQKILSEFEILSEKWKNILENIDFDSETEFSDSFRNIAAYYIYRYFLKSVYDYDAITKVRACVFSCEVISRVLKCGINLEDAARMYSKEAEYSAENIENLYDLL